MNWKEIGEHAHQIFVKERFADKTVTLMHPTKKLKKSVKKIKQFDVDVHKETLAALRIIDIARCRGYDMSFSFDT